MITRIKYLMILDVECWIMPGKDTIHQYLRTGKQEVENHILLWETKSIKVRCISVPVQKGILVQLIYSSMNCSHRNSCSNSFQVSMILADSI